MNILFIYAYKELLTGAYIYVGSTQNPRERHRLRVRRLGCPFDRELAKRPGAFVYEIVEAFIAPHGEASKIAAIRENQWMDVLATYRTPHGFNFQRADIPFKDRTAWLAARQRAQTTPEALAKKSASQKAAYAEKKKERTSRARCVHEEIFLCRALVSEEAKKRRKLAVNKRANNRKREANRCGRCGVISAVRRCARCLEKGRAPQYYGA